MTPSSPDWQQRFSQRMARVRASEIRELLKLLDQPDILSFAGGIPDPALFPTAQIQAAYDEILCDPAASRQALQYSVSEGYLPLRRWIAERMARDGVVCDEHNILLTAGSQQALDLLGKLFLSPGDTVVVARPTYLGALQAFNAYGPDYLDLPEGALRDTREAEAFAAKTPARSLGYFVPDFANPTGQSLTLAERAALFDLAERLDMTLIEDAAYRELRFEGVSAQPGYRALRLDRGGEDDLLRNLLQDPVAGPADRLGLCAHRGHRETGVAEAGGGPACFDHQPDGGLRQHQRGLRTASWQSADGLWR
jgi:DNA-binding transcriptional MocR family regulator